MASERTPLLVEQGSSDHEATVYAFPSLKRALRLLSTQQPPLCGEHSGPCARVCSCLSLHQQAFLFAVVLHLEASVNADGTSTGQHISAIARTVHALTVELWASYSELRLEEADVRGISVQHEILEMLWTPILVDDENGSGPEYTTVGELLDVVPKNSVLLEQPPVARAIEYSWKYGPHSPSQARAHSTLASVLERISRPISPRVSHLLDAIIYTTYIGCEAHVVITGLRDHFGRQDIWILVYSAYALLPFPLPPRRRPARRRRKYFVPRRVGFILALLAYLTPPYERPKPETLPHLSLLLSVGWNIFRLILAPGMSPGWILALPLRASLVPALEFNRFLRPVVLRPLTYFLPLIIFFALMLSMSMDDPWTLQSVATYATSILRKPIIVPAPYDTREAFFIFLLISITLWIFFSMASLIRVAASLSSTSFSSSHTTFPSSTLISPAHSRHPTGGSTFPTLSSLPSQVPLSLSTRGDNEDGGRLRADATRVLLHNTLLYKGYHFPAPISFIPFLFISVPSFLLRHLSTFLSWTQTQRNGVIQEGEVGGKNIAKILKVIEGLEGILWWIIIWPPSIVLATFWGVGIPRASPRLWYLICT